MLSIEIGKPKHFGKILEVSQNIVENVVLEFSKTRLIFGDQERGGAALIFADIRAKSSLFSNYNYTFKENKVIKIDIGSLKSKIDRASKDHKVVLEYDGGNHLLVKLIGKGNKSFKIHLQEVNEGTASFPKKAKDMAEVSLTTKPSLLEEALADLGTIKSDRFFFEVLPDKILFHTKKSGEEAESEFPFTTDYFVGDQTVGDSFTNLYTHEFIKKIVTITKMSNYLNWKINKNGPMLIGVQIAKDAYFWFMMVSYSQQSQDSVETDAVEGDESFDPESEADDDYDPEPGEEPEEAEEDSDVEDILEFPDPDEE